MSTRYSPGDPVPEGHIVGRDQDGNRWLLDVAARTDVPPASVLTDDEVARIRAFKEILAEHERSSLEQALANFSKERVPAREIRVWERITCVYQEELSARAGADEAERTLLYRVVFACSFGAGIANVLSMVPAAKSLPELERVIERYVALSDG